MSVSLGDLFGCFSLPMALLLFGTGTGGVFPQRSLSLQSEMHSGDPVCFCQHFQSCDWQPRAAMLSA